MCNYQGSGKLAKSDKEAGGGERWLPARQLTAKASANGRPENTQSQQVATVTTSNTHVLILSRWRLAWQARQLCWTSGSFPWTKQSSRVKTVEYKETLKA